MTIFAICDYICYRWLIDNHLFMHKVKTESMLFGTGLRLALFTSFSVAMKKQFITLLSMNMLGFFSMRHLRGMRTLKTLSVRLGRD